MSETEQVMMTMPKAPEGWEYTGKFGHIMYGAYLDHDGRFREVTGAEITCELFPTLRRKPLTGLEWAKAQKVGMSWTHSGQRWMRIHNGVVCETGVWVKDCPNSRENPLAWEMSDTTCTDIHVPGESE